METNKNSKQNESGEKSEVKDGQKNGSAESKWVAAATAASSLEALEETRTPADQGEADQQNRALDECQKEKDDLLDRLLRKQAEFDNYRKRQDREKKELSLAVKSEVLREILPVADACERALKALGTAETPLPSSESFRSGLGLIYRQFLDALARFDVQPIQALSQPFDPALHYAILREETDLYPENQVIEELQKGYTFENRLLRPSQVKVAIPRSSRTCDKDD
jgi:molecular chaperone GrpE